MNLLDHVRITIQQHNLFEPGDTVVVGVSGGPDSLALLHILRALREELQINLHVAHLNHQLRGADSEHDAGFIAALAREWQLPATIEARDVAAFARTRKLSPEDAARQVRYAFLVEVARKIGARVIAVGHQADDQAETVLMHFVRGAGLAGLRGMPYKFEIHNSKFVIRNADPRITNYELRIVRPLLDAWRGAIEEYCAKNYLAVRVDETNFDTAILRNRIRREVIPYLENLNPNLRATLTRTARVLNDDYDFLLAQARAAYLNVADESEGAVIFERAAWRALPPALQRATLRLAIEHLRGDLRDVDWTNVEDARRIALEKNVNAKATLPHGLVLLIGYARFIVTETGGRVPLPDAPLLHVDRLALPRAGSAELPESNWVVETGIVASAATVDQWTALLDPAKCVGEIYLRTRRAGDRFQPAGMQGHSQWLNEFMIDQKIPSAIRDWLPLLIVNDHIGWVCGWRVDERVRAKPDSPRAWRVTFRKK